MRKGEQRINCAMFFVMRFDQAATWQGMGLSGMIVCFVPQQAGDALPPGALFLSLLLFNRGYITHIYMRCMNNACHVRHTLLGQLRG
jgi:hypothetical protein